MKTNVAIDLTDDQRSHMANLVDGKQSKRLLTRQEVNDITREFWQRLEDLDVTDPNLPDPVGDVISDINRGAWTFIGQPPASS